MPPNKDACKTTPESFQVKGINPSQSGSNDDHSCRWRQARWQARGEARNSAGGDANLQPCPGIGPGESSPGALHRKLALHDR